MWIRKHSDQGRLGWYFGGAEKCPFCIRCIFGQASVASLCQCACVNYIGSYTQAVLVLGVTACASGGQLGRYLMG